MISEETLTYYYYNDGLSARQRAEVEAGLESSAELTEQYTSLCRELDLLILEDDAPASDLLMHRLHDQLQKSIDRARNSEASMIDDTNSSTGSSEPGATHSLAGRITALAATLILGFGVGAYYFESASTELPENYPVKSVVSHEVNQGQSAGSSSTPFLRGLQVHLRNARLELDRGGLIDNADSSTRYQALLNVAGQNRMFEKAAELNHASSLARVLRAFEPSLLRLAEEQLTSEQALALHAKLAFEIDVMLTKLSRNPSDGRYSI